MQAFKTTLKCVYVKGLYVYTMQTECASSVLITTSLHIVKQYNNPKTLPKVVVASHVWVWYKGAALQTLNIGIELL